jgi:hypothetical protein
MASEMPSRCDIIKIDVEGAELLAFEGGKRTLKQFRPLIIFEMQPALAKNIGVLPDGAWRLLGDLGYEFYRWNEGKLIPIIEPLAANIIARHPSMNKGI